MNLVLSSNIFLYSLFVFMTGSCLGSFFKLITDRYGSGESIILKHSYCTYCKNNILWWHNIPIISYILLQGKCFFCKGKIDPSCFASELIASFTALILFISLYLKKISLPENITLTAFIMLLLLLAMLDLKHRVIPHTITYTAIIAVILFKFFFTDEKVISTLASLGIAFLFMDFLYLFSSLIKKFVIQIALTSIPLILWSIFFFFNQNLLSVLFSVVIFYLLVKIKQLEKIKTASYIFLFTLVTIQMYKLALLEQNLSLLNIYFGGIGLIYFFCEVLFYFISLIFQSKNQEVLDTTLNEGALTTIGGGDITVFALICTLLGYKLGFLVLFIASLFSLISHFILRVMTKLKIVELSPQAKNTAYIPFIPYFFISCFIIIVTFYG